MPELELPEPEPNPGSEASWLVSQLLCELIFDIAVSSAT